MPSSTSLRSTQAESDTGKSFEPFLSSAQKPAVARSTVTKDNTSDGDAKSKSSKSGESGSKKSDSAPVVAAVDPTPQPEQPAVLKTFEKPHPVEQPVQQPAAEVFTLPLPQPTPAPADAAAPAAAPTDAPQDAGPLPVDPGSLVFQLSLSAPQAASKDQPVKASDHKAEAPVFSMPEEAHSSTETHTSSAQSETKDQEQPQQQAAEQPLPPSTDSTIASTFGFQPPITFTPHAPVKTEAASPAAATRAVENVSTSDLPSAPSVDRISLTIRGEGDQVVRVAINQSGEMVQVGVNTANADLAGQLRDSVPELVRRLDQQGYDPKVSIPTFQPGSPIALSTAHSEFRSGADSNGNMGSNSDLSTRDEAKQQRQRNAQKAWRELASQLQDD